MNVRISNKIDKPIPNYIIPHSPSAVHLTTPLIPET